MAKDPIQRDSKGRFKKGYQTWKTKKPNHHICLLCKKKFTTPPSIQRKFCSYKCYWKYKLGRPISLKTKLKKSLTLLKKNRYSRKKSKTLTNYEIRRSLKYKLWRTAIFVRDNYTCQICGKRGGKLNADHIKPFAFYPELRFMLSNGRTLCVKCHKTTPSYLNRHIKSREDYEKNYC